MLFNSKYFFTIGAFFLYIFFQFVEDLWIIFSAEYEAMSEFMENFAGIVCIVYLIAYAPRFAIEMNIVITGNSYTI